MFDTTFNISTFGEDERGEIYVVDLAGEPSTGWWAPVPRTGHDFDSDGKSDILWRHSGGFVSMWLMNGSTISSNIGVGGTDTSWQIVGTADNTTMSGNIPGTGDFNGDGKADILWRNSSGTCRDLADERRRRVCSDLGVGAARQPPGRSSGSATSTATARPTSCGGTADGSVVDLADERRRRISANAASGAVPTRAGRSSGIGDFNGDGKADILWRHSDGMPAIWLMNGTSVSSNASIGAVPMPTGRIVGTGDFNGDGKADILWRHTQRLRQRCG